MFEKEINCGVEFLNINRPNWLNLIDIDLLDMTMPQFCILGQIGDDFYYVRKEMNLSCDDTHKMGFNCTFQQRSAYLEDWDTLTKEWKDKIVSLRNEANKIKD